MYILRPVRIALSQCTSKWSLHLAETYWIKFFSIYCSQLAIHVNTRFKMNWSKLGASVSFFCWVLCIEVVCVSNIRKFVSWFSYLFRYTLTMSVNCPSAIHAQIRHQRRQKRRVWECTTKAHATELAAAFSGPNVGCAGLTEARPVRWTVRNVLPVLRIAFNNWIGL